MENVGIQYDELSNNRGGSKMAIIRYFFTLLVGYSFMFCVFVTGSNAATINAQSVSYSDVSAAVSAAAPGDTVVVPAGTATWSTSLTITKDIKLVGAGIDSTTITANGISSIITVSVSGDKTIDISGFTLDANSNSVVLDVMNSSNSTPIYNFRIHHNKLKNASSYCIRPWGLVFGLIDNNQFVSNRKDFDPNGKQDYSWNLFPGKDNVGSQHYLYIEDNTFSETGNMGIEGGEGTRWVYRYNTFDGSKVGTGGLWLDFHGDTRNRGSVACEIYENTVSGYQFKGIDLRGGTAIVFNNHINMTGGSYEGRIIIREEYGNNVSPCDTPGNCYSDDCGDVVNNTYVWNNWNDYSDAAIQIVVSDCCIDPYDDVDCLNEDTNWWDDYNDSNFITGLSFSRPGTCSDDDCYWETDTSKLYRCDGANNWTLVYEPYTYPHPLSKPSPPQNPRIK